MVNESLIYHCDIMIDMIYTYTHGKNKLIDQWRHAKIKAA